MILVGFLFLGFLISLVVYENWKEKRDDEEWEE